MVRKEIVLLPQMQDYLTVMGEQIQKARLRRSLSSALAAERADISVSTLHRVEKGDKNVPIGIYAQVLHAIGGMDKDLLLIAKDEKMEQARKELNLSPW